MNTDINNNVIAILDAGTVVVKETGTPITLSHNELEGLNVGDYQHLTEAEKAIIDVLDTSGAGDLFLADDGTYKAVGGGGDAVWGDITGTLSNQPDLQSALEGKSNTNHNHNLNDLTEKSYNSLTDKPTIPTALSQLSKDINFDERYYTETESDTLLSNKQNTLVSGVNIKTVNDLSLVGSGNITIGGSGSVAWGSISGTLADQTDLNSALAGKEPVITTKNTAFNKNFGTAIDTVCQGNDARLSDARTPLAHNQAISTITNLQDILDDKQETLINESNIKSINGVSLLGTGSINLNDTYYTETEVDTLLGGKVDTVVGKGLSTEDYTTAEKSKLAGIAENANNYVHPANHPPSIISQDTNNRFVTDTEKSTWNGKSDFSGDYDDLMDKPDLSSLHIHANKATLDTVSGTNTGDETTATIKTKLGSANTTTDGYLTSTDWNTFNNKQATLVSGTNIKTINSSSLLGSGDIEIGGGGGETVNIETLSANKTLTASDATVQIYTSTTNRQIQLPTTGIEVGHKFVFVNNNAYDNSSYYDIKQNTTSINLLYSQSVCTVFWDGTNWIMPEKNNVAMGYNANGSSSGVAMGYNANGSSSGAAVGYGARGSSYGAAVGYNANGYASGVAVGYGASGSSYGAAVGRDATTGGKGDDTCVYGAYSKAERNREFISTATESTTNKAQLTFQKFREKDLATNAGAWQELFADASSARLVMIARSVYQFTCQINAIDTNHVVKCWELKGAVKRNNSNNTSLVGTVTKTVIAADTGTDNWDVQITADDTNEAIKVEVKHDAVVNVRYSLNFFATETRI